MAASHRSKGSIAAAMLAVLLAGGSVAQERSRLPIQLDAASSDVDYKSNRVRFRDVTISQGDTTVKAERAEATGLDFEDSRWVFEGDVQIQVEPQGALRSSRAIVEFRGNRIERALITGTPAEFEQQRPDVTARGRAGAIEYVFADGTVRLSEEAWLTDGRNEITGPLLVYNIHQQRVQAASEPGGSERVRITINPGKDNGQTPEPPKPRDAKP